MAVQGKQVVLLAGTIGVGSGVRQDQQTELDHTKECGLHPESCEEPLEVLFCVSLKV